MAASSFVRPLTGRTLIHSGGNYPWQVITYKADANGSIAPDSDIEKISKVALDNGSVKVSGRDQKGAVNLNSEQFPEELHDKFDPEVQSERNAFNALLPPSPPIAD
ncbi:DUF4747 family protein [Rhizobium leguminosarum]